MKEPSSLPYVGTKTKRSGSLIFWVEIITLLSTSYLANDDMTHIFTMHCTCTYLVKKACAFLVAMSNCSTTVLDSAIIESWTRITPDSTHPGKGPPFMRSNTWAGFSSCLNLRRNLTPWLSPDLEFTNTSRGDVLPCRHLVASHKPSESMDCMDSGHSTEYWHSVWEHLRGSWSLHKVECTWKQEISYQSLWRSQNQCWMVDEVEWTQRVILVGS